MSDSETPQVTIAHSAATADGFGGSFALFATIVMVTFVAAIAIAIVGFAQPSWLGFS